MGGFEGLQAVSGGLGGFEGLETAWVWVYFGGVKNEKTCFVA